MSEQSSIVQPNEESSSEQKLFNSLCDAAQGGRLEDVRLLLGQGINVNTQSKKGRTTLRAAIQGKNEQIMKLILDCDANINAQIDVSGSDLQLAASEGSEQIVKLFLDRGANVNVQIEHYASALQIAASKGSEQTVKLLLDCGADVNIQSAYYGSALQAAIFEGSEQIVKLLLDRGANVNVQGGNYASALQIAASKGSEQIVKLLLDCSVDVNIQSGYYGSALQAAISEGSEQIVKLLLDCGADINIQSGHYGSALHAAVFKESEQIVKLLLDRGANINIQSEYHDSALQTAVSKGSEQIVKLLLDHGADISMQSSLNKRFSILHAGIKSDKLSVLEMLFSAGADIHLNSQDDDGRTPLHLAVESPTVEMVKYLLEKGASPDIPDFSDTTSFQLAMRNRTRESVLLLYPKVKHGLSSISASDWRDCLDPKHVSDFEIVGGEAPDIKIGKKLLERKINDKSYPLPVGAMEILAGDSDFINDKIDVKRIFVLTNASFLRSTTSFISHCRWWCKLGSPDLFTFWEVRKESAPSPTTVQRNSEKDCFLQTGLSLACHVLPKKMEDWSESFQLSPKFLRSLEVEHGIMWIMRRSPSKDITSVTSTSSVPLLQSQIYFSTSEYAQIPTYATDLFVPLVRKLRGIWNGNMAKIKRRLLTLRSRVFDASGEDPYLIRYLLNEFQLLEALRDNLKEQLETLQAFHRRYSSDSWKVLHEQPSDQVKAEMDKFGKEVEDLKKNGEDEVKSLTELSQNIIQLEFSLTSISEAQKSTSTNRSLKRLTWITFLFLPLLFISSLFGMNVDILANNPAWWWYPLLAGGVTVFTFAMWIIFKMSETLEGNLENKFNWLFRKRREEPDPEKAETSEVAGSEVEGSEVEGSETERSESWARKAKTKIISALKRKQS